MGGERSRGGGRRFEGLVLWGGEEGGWGLWGLGYDTYAVGVWEVGYSVRRSGLNDDMNGPRLWDLVSLSHFEGGQPLRYRAVGWRAA